jgi:RHS repeat-associated protein
LAVEKQGEGGVRFAYDPLGRRIGEEGSEGKLWRVFFAEQEVARYKEEAGEWKLVKRMYWGDGVDELLAYDWDGDGDGEVESRLYAVTDGAGSVQALVDETGKVVETYRYGPEGRVEVRGVDSTKPEVRLVRARWVGGGQRVEVWFSEGVRVESGVVEVRSSTGQVLAGQRGGSSDGRAVWVELASPLVEGQSYTVHVEGVVDGAGNALAEPVELAFSGPSPGGEVVVPGAEGGGLVAVVDGLEGLVVVAGVPVKGETVAGSLVVRRGGVEVPGAVSLVGEQAGAWQGRVLVWRPEDARAYGVGEYVVSFSPALADGAGRPLAGPGSVRFVHRGEGDVVWVEAWQVPVRAFSAFGNDHFLHGRPYVASVGLYDHRARFYEARTGTFLEPDPLGPVDSPNLYQAFSFDTLSVTDPWGLAGDYNFSVFDSAGKVTKPLILVKPIAPFKPVEVPQLAEVEIWYDVSRVGYMGRTLIGSLADARARLLPLAQQARLLQQHPFLQGPDNPGLAQLIRSPQLVKYSEQELLKIYGQWVLLNLTVVQIGGFATATVAGGLALGELAGTAYAMGDFASKVLLAQSAATHAIQGDWKGLASDYASYRVERALQTGIGKITELTKNETYILLSQASLFADSWAKNFADILLEQLFSEKGQKPDLKAR